MSDYGNADRADAAKTAWVILLVVILVLLTLGFIYFNQPADAGSVIENTFKELQWNMNW